MKTPKEIKKGLEIAVNGCLTCDCCITDCPHGLECHPMNEDTNVDMPKQMAVDALAYIQQLEAQVPKWISVGNPPQKESEYIMIVQLPDGKKERIWDVFHPYHGWCEDGEGKKVLCWMSFDSLPEPPKEG